ncbi:acetylornithine transaminase [Demequina sp. NBRC 110053]|uniref:acetylornithine transaminase n=1 Tax=Demequina sp. NBRC 110053 TaxID=1570342 RepID=UPI000A0367E4|nr:acetylornithine transaminase [Demequina sp. NBRC 110053]
MTDLSNHGEAGLEKGAVDLQRYSHAIMGTFGVPMRVLTRGEGSYVWDADGNRYLDLLGGIAVNALGHGHPAWVEAIASQAATLSHTSNFFATEPQIALAERLLDLAHAPSGSRVFFANSGTEANEAAIKMARKTGKGTIIALEGGFHGRSTGALALTHKEAYRAPFAPLIGDVVFVPPNDEEALRAAVTEHAADLSAIVVEPIQGEAGVIPLSHAYLALARTLTRRHDALLILDEVQTGVARTGAWFAHQLHGIQPDVMTLAKGLGGGFPIGALVAFGDGPGAMLGKGEHGTTFGGNALAAAAALATLRVIEDEDLIANVKAVGAHLRERLEAMDGVVEVRGEGLMLGVGLAAPQSAEIAQAAVAAGFIVNPPSPDTLRLIPALTLTTAEADTFLTWLEGHFEAHPLAAESASDGGTP